MKEKLINLAKQKGFKSNYLYNEETKHSSNEDLRYLFWMTELQKWLRKVYEVHSLTTLGDLGKYEYEKVDFRCGIFRRNPVVYIVVPGSFNSYEESLEASLFEALQLIEVS